MKLEPIVAGYCYEQFAHFSRYFQRLGTTTASYSEMLDLE